jgi:hypothetical protein
MRRIQEEIKTNCVDKIRVEGSGCWSQGDNAKRNDAPPKTCGRKPKKCSADSLQDGVWAKRGPLHKHIFEAAVGELRRSKWQLRSLFGKIERLFLMQNHINWNVVVVKLPLIQLILSKIRKEITAREGLWLSPIYG